MIQTPKYPNTFAAILVNGMIVTYALDPDKPGKWIDPLMTSVSVEQIVDTQQNPPQVVGNRPIVNLDSAFVFSSNNYPAEMDAIKPEHIMWSYPCSPKFDLMRGEWLEQQRLAATGLVKANPGDIARLRNLPKPGSKKVN